MNNKYIMQSDLHGMVALLNTVVPHHVRLEDKFRELERKLYGDHWCMMYHQKTGRICSLTK